MDLRILYEDNHIIVCDKPQGISSQSDKTTDYDMVNRLKNYLFEKEEEKGIPYIGLVHRLDKPVGGIMVFAKTPYAAKELSRQVQNRTIKKYYHTIITDDLSEQIGKEPVLLTDYLVKDGKNNISGIADKTDKRGKKAQLMYQVLKVDKSKNRSLLEIELLTGRHHQIRVQMAEHFGGILGDSKYNEANQEVKNICLYAVRLQFQHPKTKKEMEFSVETPEWEL